MADRLYDKAGKAAKDYMNRLLGQALPTVTMEMVLIPTQVSFDQFLTGCRMIC